MVECTAWKHKAYAIQGALSFAACYPSQMAKPPRSPVPTMLDTLETLQQF